METVEKAGPEGRVRPSGIYFGGVVVLGDLFWGPVSLGSMPGIPGCGGGFSLVIPGILASDWSTVTDLCTSWVSLALSHHVDLLVYGSMIIPFTK